MQFSRTDEAAGTKIHYPCKIEGGRDSQVHYRPVAWFKCTQYSVCKLEVYSINATLHGLH